jgi:phage terminase small subunit
MPKGPIDLPGSKPPAFTLDEWRQLFNSVESLEEYLELDRLFVLDVQCCQYDIFEAAKVRTEGGNAFRKWQAENNKGNHQGENI